jgi:hypothetical protein
VDLVRVSVEASQVVHFYLSIDQETFDSGYLRATRLKCAEAQFSTNDRGTSAKKSGKYLAKKAF